ncbi:MAG TPA: glycosyltransferase [Candidatus Limnocylindrales bacterium]|nr:glycosyltransferase [Candidatus Limnocylindrales bacterium]
MMDIDLSVVIPVYNEETNIKILIPQVKSVLDKIKKTYEIILVDDGSSDGTFKTLKKLAEQDPNLKLVRFRRNFGQTAALSAGFDLARGKVVIPMDGDLQNDPEDIPRLLEKMEEGYDVVSGWRENRKDRFLTRKLPSYLANKLISITTRVHLHDYGCTLKAYKKEILDGIQLYGEMHRFIPALASWMGVRVAEIKVNHRPREYGNSKYGLSRTIKVLLDLINVKFLLSYSTKPLHLFGSIGLFFMVCSLFLLIVSLSFKFTYHTLLSNNSTFLLSIIFFLVGIILICMGLLGEIMVRMYYESQHKPIYVIAEKVNFE